MQRLQFRESFCEAEGHNRIPPNGRSLFQLHYQLCFEIIGIRHHLAGRDLFIGCAAKAEFTYS